MTAPPPLTGLRVFDLTRILAGPTCTQILGDLGADVIKIERAAAGDDTRKFGPPWLKDAEGKDTAESAYFLSANRNKRSLTLDLAKPEGQALARRLIARCDILVENFKVGDLAKYGLAYEQLKEQFPKLIYCSITGFGQTGPYAPRPGYDYLAQGMGGFMSLNGQPEGTPGAEPLKAGIAVADITTGLYGVIAILAALRHRDATGQGQRIDLALLDTQISWLANEGSNYLVTGKAPKRLGNAHPNIVPYQVFPAADGYLILAVGNDGQFRRFCEIAGRADLAEDPRFASNPARVRNREFLVPILREIIAAKPRDYWLERLEPAGVPSGPVNTLDQVFADPQVVARGMRLDLPHGRFGVKVPSVASPLKMSETPPTYRHAPPALGEHTDEVLHDLLSLSESEIAALRNKGIV
ncbi:MAG: CoA transferase [Alphaproteobacteria bacterium]|nr:CoA transferase [Alphaproteobacteria bacterium]